MQKKKILLEWRIYDLINTGIKEAPNEYRYREKRTVS